MIPYSYFSGNTTAMNELSEIVMVILIFLVILMTAFRLKFFKIRGQTVDDGKKTLMRSLK